jgi:hypothetical protein
MQKAYPKLFTSPLRSTQRKNAPYQNKNDQKSMKIIENTRSLIVEIIMHGTQKTSKPLNLASNFSTRFSASSVDLPGAFDIPTRFQWVTLC